MNHIPLVQIHVPETRQRRQFTDQEMYELAESIAWTGLLNPIVVRTNGSSGALLVAGERRLRAVAALAEYGILIRHAGRSVPLDHIPCTLIGELDERPALEAELEENIIRTDLTWQERSMAIARLMEMRAAAAEAIGRTYLPIDLAQDTGATNVTLQVTQPLILTQHMHRPAIAQAKTQKDAIRALRFEMTREHNQAVAATLPAHSVSARHTCIHGDAVTEMACLPADTFDCILTDPPYGINAHRHETYGCNPHTYADSYAGWQTLIRWLSKESFRVAAPQAHLYCFCDVVRFPEMAAAFREAGWMIWRTPLIWRKQPGRGVAPLPHLGPRRVYEAIMYGIKGERRPLKLGDDVIDIDAADTTIHKAEKPVRLYEELLTRTCLAGQRVLDPFCGSGTIFPAAERQLLTATGIEIDDNYYAIAVKRMEEAADG